MRFVGFSIDVFRPHEEKKGMFGSMQHFLGLCTPITITHEEILDLW